MPVGTGAEVGLTCAVNVTGLGRVTLLRLTVRVIDAGRLATVTATVLDVAGALLASPG